jgi:hypothetical protein
MNIDMHEEIKEIERQITSELRQINQARSKIQEDLSTLRQQRSDLLLISAEDTLPDLDAGTVAKAAKRLPAVFSRTSTKRHISESRITAPFWIWITGRGKQYRAAATSKARDALIPAIIAGIEDLQPKPTWCLPITVCEEQIETLSLALVELSKRESVARNRMEGIQRLKAGLTKQGGNRTYSSFKQAASTARKNGVPSQSAKRETRTDSSDGLSWFDIWLISQMSQSHDSPAPTPEIFHGHGGDTGGGGATASFDDAPVDRTAAAIPLTETSVLSVADTAALSNHDAAGAQSFS